MNLMNDQYATARDEHLRLLEEIENDPVIDKSLDLSLPNKSEETNHDGWLEGAKKFADDNYALLKDWVK